MATPASRFLKKDAPENRAYSITCRECGEKATIEPNNPTGTLPPEMIAKKFTRRGWKVGSTPRKDKCPACYGRHEEDDEVPTYTVDKNLRVDMPTPPTLTIVPKEPKVAALTREHRRIVLAKLNDVYLDEDQGYMTGWTDQRVAEDLGIDVQSVVELRQENFGDLPVSAIDRSFLDEGHKILEQIKELALEAAAAKDRAEKLAQDALEALEALQAIDRKLDDLLAQEQLLAEQIAKVAHAA